jgi:hypothetical protein
VSTTSTLAIPSDVSRTRQGSRVAQFFGFVALMIVNAILNGLVIVVVILVSGPKLGFRRRDVLGLVVPIVGLFWMVQILWRSAHARDPYWSMREETPRSEPRGRAPGDEESLIPAGSI